MQKWSYMFLPVSTLICCSLGVVFSRFGVGKLAHNGFVAAPIVAYSQQHASETIQPVDIKEQRGRGSRQPTETGRGR